MKKNKNKKQTNKQTNKQTRRIVEKIKRYTSQKFWYLFEAENGVE